MTPSSSSDPSPSVLRSDNHPADPFGKRPRLLASFGPDRRVVHHHDLRRLRDRRRPGPRPKRPEDRDRHDRGSRLDRESPDARPHLTHSPIRRAATLGENPDGLAPSQSTERLPDGAFVVAPSYYGEDSPTSDEPADSRQLENRAERKEPDAALDPHGEKNRVEIGRVVRGQDHRPPFRNVLDSSELNPVKEAQEGVQDSTKPMHVRTRSKSRALSIPPTAIDPVRRSLLILATSCPALGLRPGVAVSSPST